MNQTNTTWTGVAVDSAVKTADITHAFFWKHPVWFFIIFVVVLIGGFTVFSIWFDKASGDMKMTLFKWLIIGCFAIGLFLLLVVLGETNKLLW